MVTLHRNLENACFLLKDDAVENHGSTFLNALDVKARKVKHLAAKEATC